VDTAGPAIHFSKDGVVRLSIAFVDSDAGMGWHSSRSEIETGTTSLS
jgi:hypothetical protein